VGVFQQAKGKIGRFLSLYMEIRRGGLKEDPGKPPQGGISRGEKKTKTKDYLTLFRQGGVIKKKKKRSL